MSKKKSDTIYKFNAIIEPLEVNTPYAGISIPQEIIEEISLKKGITRVNGLLNNTPFNLAFHNRKDGSKYLMIAGTLRREAKVKIGYEVVVQFEVVDSNILEIPEELEAVLEQDDFAKEFWNSLSTGYRRSLVHYITTSKNIDIRIKRSLELIRRAKAGELNIQKNKKEKE